MFTIKPTHKKEPTKKKQKMKVKKDCLGSFIHSDDTCDVWIDVAPEKGAKTTGAANLRIGVIMFNMSSWSPDNVRLLFCQWRPETSWNHGLLLTKKIHVSLQFIANKNKHKHLYYLINRFPPMQPIYLEALVINMEMAPKLAAAAKRSRVPCNIFRVQ